MGAGAGLGVEPVDQVDNVEEPSAAAVPDAGPCDADGEMGFAGAGSADQHDIALLLEKVSGGEFTNRRLIDGFDGEAVGVETDEARLGHARRVLAAWRADYNAARPNTSLGGLTQIE